MKQIVAEQLASGLDTVIHCNGGEFSGGQRQHLQLCLLLLRNNPMVLLDECTSALDKATISGILKVLNDFLGANKTLIMATHDIQTLKIAQHVLNRRISDSYDLQALDHQST